MLPLLARTLGVSVEKLIGEQPSAAARKRGPVPKIQQHLEPFIRSTSSRTVRALHAS
jgi:hypothetical protein